MHCGNAFTTSSCRNVGCAAVSNICVQPHLGEFVSGSDCGDPDCGITMPEHWLVVIEWPDLEDTPGFPYYLVNKSAGRIELIGETLIQPQSYCKFFIPFHSDIYPIYNAQDEPPAPREFSILVPLDQSQHGPISLFNQRYGTGPYTPVCAFGPGIDRRRVVPGGFCVDHNQVGTFNYIPPGSSTYQLPWIPYSGDYPPLPITVSIYPLAESP